MYSKKLLTKANQASTMPTEQTPEKQSFFKKIAQLQAIISGRNLDAKNVFIDYHLIRRKYILSRICEHYGIDKFEPAPLLNKTLLDVGCGTNRIAQELALRGANCLAIDLSHEAVSKAKESAEKYGAPVVFVQGFAENLVQETAQYDTIICLDVLESTETPDKLIWAISKMLKQDGILIFSSTICSPTSWFYHKVLAEWILKWLPKGFYTYKPFLKEGHLQKLLEKHGLKQTHLTGVRFSPFSQSWYKSEKVNLRVMGAAIHQK